MEWHQHAVVQILSHLFQVLVYASHKLELLTTSMMVFGRECPTFGEETISIASYCFQKNNSRVNIEQHECCVIFCDFLYKNFFDNNISHILDPSNGYAGSKLKIPKHKLIIILLFIKRHTTNIPCLTFPDVSANVCTSDYILKKDCKYSSACGKSPFPCQMCAAHKIAPNGARSPDIS